MNRYGLVIVAVAVVLLTMVSWKPPRQFAGFGSPDPSPSPSPTVEPTPSATPEPTPEEVAAEPPVTAPDKCMDGSALTVTARDENQVSYKCESGATGVRLKR